MARKSLAVVDPQVQQAVDNFRSESEIKAEIAKAAYDAQDPETQDMIDQMQRIVALNATGYITVQLQPPHGAVYPVKIEQQLVDYQVLYIVMDLLKNLALLDIKVGEYKFPPSLCTECEAEITVKRGRKRGA